MATNLLSIIFNLKNQPDQETHDQRLHAVLERFKSCGLTSNADKCQFNMDELIFMGMLL